MNKFLVPIILGVLFIASGVFNVLQYNSTKILKEKLSFFESRFGAYEDGLESIKRANEAKYKLEHTITVYFIAGAPESNILTFKSILEGESGVQSVQYISANQALANFKTRHKDDPTILQALEKLGTNPLNATLTITLTDPSQKQPMDDFIKANIPNYIIDKVTL